MIGKHSQGRRLTCVLLLLLMLAVPAWELAPPQLAMADSQADLNIVVEDADEVWANSLQYSVGLANVAGDVTPRVVVEYAASISEFGLQSSEDLNQVADAVSSRVVVEYADSIAEFSVQGSEDLDQVTSTVTPRVIIEYANSICHHGLQEPFVTNNPPNQPTNLSPADGDTEVSTTPTLQSSDFSDPDSGDTHSASQWQITTTFGDYSSPVFDSGTDSSNLTQITIPAETLDYSITYYWHVRHQDNHGSWSEWSMETRFTTSTHLQIGDTVATTVYLHARDISDWNNPLDPNNLIFTMHPPDERTKPPYDVGKVIDGPETDTEYGYTWWKIEWDNGEIGWSAEGSLEEPPERWLVKSDKSFVKMEDLEDAFNYQGGYGLSESQLKPNEKDALPYVMKYANKYHISPALIMAVIRQESDFDPNAEGDYWDGEYHSFGYMQVSYGAATDTYTGYAGDEYKGTEEQWKTAGLDPEINIKYGTRYLRIQHDRIKDGCSGYEDVYGDILKSTVSAYNAGHPTLNNRMCYVLGGRCNGEYTGVIEGKLVDAEHRGYKFFLSIRVTINQPPVADAGPDQSASSGDLVYFDGSNSYDPDGTIVSYEWDFGDGEAAGGHIVSHRFRGATNEPRTYTVTLTVEDDSGCIATDTTCVTVTPLEKTVEVSHQPAVPVPGQSVFGKMTVSYNWIHDDTYVVSKIHYESEGFLGVGVISIWDYHSHVLPVPVWTADIFSFGKHKEKTYYPELEQILYGGDTFEGISVDAFDVMNIFIEGWAGISVSIGPSLPVPFFETNSACFQPDYTEVPDHPVDISDMDLARLCSPGEVRVYDSEDRVTGLVDGEIREEIPHSAYDDGTIIIVWSSFGPYRYEVEGTDEATYGLDIGSIEDGEATAFAAADVATISGAVHEYTIDWDALSEGEKGVTIRKDSDGDGEFEETIVTSQPNTPSNPSPLNHAATVSAQTDLSWTGGDPDAGDIVTYDVYFDTANATTLVCNDQLATTYDPGTLGKGTTCYWRIVARDNHGVTTEGPVWNFTTQAEAGRKGDFDNDGDIDLVDFFLFAAAYGLEPGDDNYNPAGDFDDNDVINLVDFFLFAAVYGT